MTREEVIGKSSLQQGFWNNPEDRSRLVDLLRKEGYCLNFDTKLCTKSGSLKTVLLSARIIELDGIPHSILFIRDITERRRATDALRQSEERFRAIFQTCPDAVCVTSIEDGVFVDVNDRLLELLGITREQIIGKGALELQLWDSPSERDHLIAILKAQGLCRNFMAKFRSFDGERFTALLSARVIQLENGPHMLAFLRDITEHEKSQAALRIIEDRFRTIFQTSPDSFTISRLEDSVFTDVNDGFTKLTCYSREEAIGKSALDLNLWETPDERKRLLDILRTEGTCRSMESRIRTKDGVIHTGLASARLVEVEGVPHVAIYIRDISEQKKIESDLRESREQLRHLTQHNESIREEERKWVAREVHDELGQVLTALKIDFAWIKKRLPEDNSTFSEKVVEIDHLVDSAMQSIKKISVRLRPIPLEELGFQAACEWLIQDFSERTKINCVTSLKLNKRTLSSERCTALFRILQEALNNVARHANASQVSISLAIVRDYVVLRIKDNGIGIHPSNVKKVTSFGLAGMRERAEYFGGHVVVGKNSENGTTVTAEIPVREKGSTNDKNTYR